MRERNGTGLNGETPLAQAAWMIFADDTCHSPRMKDMTSIVEHLAFIQRRLAKANPQGVYIFGALCLERQLPVYLRAAIGKTWSHDHLLKHSLDTLWAAIYTGSPLPIALHEGVVRSVDAVSEEENDIAVLAFDVACSFENLVNAYKSHKPQEVYLCAQTSISIIDNFLCILLNITSDTRADEQQILIHELMQTEISRQQFDLVVLDDCNKFCVAREESKGKSILAGYWY